MACHFSIPSGNDPSGMIARADAAIKQAGGEFTSLGNNGTFELSLPIGKIKGEFFIEGSALNIRIHHKPIFVPCGMIEQKVREYLGVSA